jgi:hypothetical protein
MCTLFSRIKPAGYMKIHRVVVQVLFELRVLFEGGTMNKIGDPDPLIFHFVSDF